MCYDVSTYMTGTSIKRLGEELDIDVDMYIPFYHASAFDLPDLMVIDQNRKPQIRTWGLIPHWSKSNVDAQQIRFKTFNARSETITEKPSFRDAYQTGRCLVPVTGYYEWQHRSSQKVPHFISLKEQECFFLGGLTTSWIEPQSGKEYNTFTIVTSEANEFAAEIHNSKQRMPLILPSDKLDSWLNEGFPAIQRTFPADPMKAHTISPLIGNRKTNRNVPQVKTPFDYGSLTLF